VIEEAGNMDEFAFVDELFPFVEAVDTMVDEFTMRIAVVLSLLKPKLELTCKLNHLIRFLK
jgi:hypothetical protein